MISYEDIERIKNALGLKNLFFTSFPKGTKPSNPKASRTHCQGMTYEISTDDENIILGIDAEETDRVSETVITRVANAGDHKPKKFSYLWTAKEAAWKAQRGPLQPLAFSLVSIKNWKVFKDLVLFDFKAQGGIQTGVTLQKENITFSFAVVRTSKSSISSHESSKVSSF